MSSFGLLVSNILSSFIIAYHAFSVYHTIFLTRIQVFPRGMDLGKARNTSEIHVWSYDLFMDRTSDGRPLGLIATPVKT